MPVTLVFWGNATITKVKNMYWGPCDQLFPPCPHQTKYLNSYDLDYDYDGWREDQDIGTTGVPGYYPYGNERYHLRLYAHNPPDYNYESFLMGQYIIGTTHIDKSAQAGWSENAAGYFIEHALTHGCQHTGYMNFQNYWGGVQFDGHFLQSNGIAEFVYVP
ncbi:MAG: hypothetical protein PHV74_09175 [Dehalococcoidia bacterium]|nr:hypothetical protein [Dehalococcoidia bacterium]